MSTNKNDANKGLVLAALEAVRTALRNESSSPSAAAALAQCDRLELSIRQFHAEGLRFAAYTLLRMVRTAGAELGEPVHSATQNLKTALDSAGYPH